MKDLDPTDKSNIRQESGVIIIELALVLPMLIFIILATFEFIRALQIRQSIAVISRESARDLFHECLELEVGGIQTCMDTVYKRSINSSDVILGNNDYEIILTIFVFDPAGAGTQNLFHTPVSGYGTGGSHTKYTTFISPIGFPPNLIDRQKRIAIAEVHYNFKILSAIPLPLAGDFYDFTVF